MLNDATISLAYCVAAYLHVNIAAGLERRAERRAERKGEYQQGVGEEVGLPVGWITRQGARRAYGLCTPEIITRGAVFLSRKRIRPHSRAICDTNHRIHTAFIERDRKRGRDSLESLSVMSVFTDRHLGTDEACVTKVVEAAICCRP